VRTDETLADVSCAILSEKDLALKTLRNLQVYSDLFPVRAGGAGTARSFKRKYSGNLESIALQSLFGRGI
jgi:hypothetical protein